MRWSQYRSFAEAVAQPGHERYMLVLEDSDTGKVGGCCAVEAACGLDEPFYNYRVGTTVHASRELKIYNLTPTLYLSNDYTGTSVLCSLYLDPAFRSGGTGHLLSRSRFMLMAQFPQRFAPKKILVAEDTTQAVYLVASATFSAGTADGWGDIVAIRVH